MSAHISGRISKPTFFRIAHLKQHRPNRLPYVIGFDSEAHSCGLSKHERCDENGYPFLYQFTLPNGHTDLLTVPRTGTRYETLFPFMEWLYEHTQRKDLEYLVFGYNLSYEYTQLFRDLDAALKDAPEFQLGIKPSEPCRLPSGAEFYIVAMNMKRYSFTIEWAGTKRRVKVIDAMAFIGGGLDKAARLIGAGRKRKKPDHFDRDSAMTPEMVEYASQDAVLTQALGEWIVSQHQRYDVTQCVSAPHFASKVYKRAYLDIEIPLAHEELEQDGLASYHGGKNGFYLDEPTEQDGIWHVDIRSAYPEAMRQLPDPERSEFLWSDIYLPGTHSIWRITGEYRKCTYRSLMGDSRWLPDGHISATVTGYELDSAMRHGEIDLASCVGWVMAGPDGGSLVRYVDDFYEMKRHASSDAERLTAKLLLNSLYGKFFQKVAQGAVGAVDIGTGEVIRTDPDLDYDYVAGGLYHPPIASLITGYVRAKIHDLEHRFTSLMTSTDGFFSLAPPPDEMLGKGLGMLSAERGRLRILRERLYVFDPEIPEHTPDCDDDCTDLHPVYALHGFIGSVKSLRAVPLSPGLRYEYVAERVVSLRMSNRRLGKVVYQPGEFVPTDRHIILPGRFDNAPG